MNIVHVTKENFEQEVLQAKLPVLVDCWATWCGPCKMLAPTLEGIAKETDAFKIVKIDVDEAPELASQFGVSSIPTLVVIKEGKEVKRTVGLIPKDAILDLMK